MKIRKLHLKNIGPFDDAEIEFPPGPAGMAEIHIFTGQNGSGKTTLLMALACAFDDVVRQGYHFQHLEYKGNAFSKRFREFGLFDEPYQVDKRDPRFGWVESRRNYKSRSIVVFQSGDIEILYGCPTCNSLHVQPLWMHDIVKSEWPKLDLYATKINQKTLPEMIDFAVFAFSGYRQMKSESVEAIKEPKDFNPLAQSLEFVKDYSHANQISINQLIANNFSKKWIESTRNPTKSKKFAMVLSSVERAIFDITGWKIEFDLQTEPTNLVLKLNGEELEFDVLPDGLRSLISWMADLLGRVDLLKWADDLPITEKNLILFLDEIEVHLHPAWQRKVLPVVQKLFKNAQIFVSTHSPFVVNSVDGAWVYDLEIDDKGKARVAQVTKSSTSQSVETVLRKIFDVDEKFGLATQDKLEDFYRQKEAILRKEKVNQAAFLKLAEELALKGAENGDSLLRSMILSELRQLNRITGSNEFEL